MYSVPATALVVTNATADGTQYTKCTLVTIAVLYTNPLHCNHGIVWITMVQRTPSQNNALHLYLTQVAKALADEGHTMQDVTKAIRRAEILPTPAAIKEVVWRPLQEIILSKKSTTELQKSEVTLVYEAMNKWLGTEFGIHIPFPQDEDRIGNYDVIIRS